MGFITAFEFDTLVEGLPQGRLSEGMHVVPRKVYRWLEAQCLRAAEEGDAPWLRVTQRHGHRAVQVTSYVGVIESPDGFLIEVLPKVGKHIAGGDTEARQLLIEMLRCLNGFRHIQTNNAKLAATRMPLLEVFIGEFLRAVEHIVKRGLRSIYTARCDNLFALRGKLLINAHLRQNRFRADRFYTEHDKFSTNRPENRLIHTALRRVLSLSTSQAHQKLARELDFVFDGIPLTQQVRLDFQQVRLDRGMGYYADALAWTRLILNGDTPLTGAGKHNAPSLLFPMEAVFESYVANTLVRQVEKPLILKTQTQSHHLVRHNEQNWFRLRPDLLIRNSSRNLAILDTKWKLLNQKKSNGAEKYGLSQADFYQLNAYGQSYLNGEGDVILVYPKTDSFDRPLAAFDFLSTKGLRLWVLPFCMKTRRLELPDSDAFPKVFLRHGVTLLER